MQTFCPWFPPVCTISTANGRERTIHRIYPREHFTLSLSRIHEYKRALSLDDVFFSARYWCDGARTWSLFGPVSQSISHPTYQYIQHWWLMMLVHELRNCSLSYARSEHSEIIDFMRNSTDSSSSDVCHEALRKLHAATEYWPIMTDGICVGMNEIGRQVWKENHKKNLLWYFMSMKVTCMTMDPTVIREKQEARIPRPKGPMTGFNYFSKTSRKRIFDEIGDEVRRGDTFGYNCFRCNDNDDDDDDDRFLS